MKQMRRYQTNLWGGIITGVIVFVVGYLLTRHLVLLGPVPSTQIEAKDSTVVGWFFYNAHHVPLAESVDMFGESMSASGYDLLKLEETSEYLEFLYVIPPLALFIGGILSASSWGKTRTVSFAVLNGASIVIGYLIASIAGVFIFSETITTFGASGTMQPDIIMSFIIAGLVYPAVFGGLGGLAYFFSQGSIQVQVT